MLRGAGGQEEQYSTQGKHQKSRSLIHRSKGITEGLLTEYRSIRCLNYVKFFGNTDYDFPQELNGIN